MDAAQEAFKRAFIRWNRLSRQEWAGGWVMTTALNVWRKERKAARGSPGKSGMIAPQPDAVRVDVVDALRRLPPRQQMAAVLYYVGDLPVAAVAEVMTISEGAVKAHLAQARAAFVSVLYRLSQTNCRN